MKNWVRAGLTRSAAKSLVIGFLVTTVTALARPKSAVDHAAERILVQPRAGTAENTVQEEFARLGAAEDGSIPQLNVRVLKVRPAARAAVLAALQHNPNFEFVEEDRVMPVSYLPNDPYLYHYGWYLGTIDAPTAWDITTGVSSIVIAILDTGVDSTHPDLAPNIVPGWNIYDNNADTTDFYGHGTSVAGEAAALGNNGLGVVGVAWGCRIMPVRVADTNGYTTASLLASGLVYAADHGARVANVSFQVSSVSTLTQAFQYFYSKGGVTTVSAGNSSTFDPSADNPYVLTVSATDSSDALAFFSCTGNNIDLAAPGASTFTTVLGGYDYFSGTSASAPIVAGVAALVLSINPAFTAADVQNILKQTADDLGAPGWDTSFGAGRVNASRAVLAASTALPSPPSDTTSPVANINSPGSGTGLAGVVGVDIGAIDDVGVARIEWYLDGALMASTSATPATFSWDTSKSANGSHSLQAKAYDAAGNFGFSAVNTVSVQNSPPVVVPPIDLTAPSVQITSPASGININKSISVTIKATDDVGVTRVDLFLDGKIAGTSTSASPSFSLTTSKLSRGQHTLQAYAYDAAGNCGKSVVVTVKK